MKKFWKYFLIVILSLIGLSAIGVLYLFFVPNSSLFGICYISYNDDYFSKNYAVDGHVINKIVLNSRNYDISVENSVNGNNNVYVKVYSNSFGFTLKKNSTVSITEKLVGDCLTFDITEPYGACFANRSKITLMVPADYNVDLSVSNHNAVCNVNAPKLIISNLACNTNNGEFVLENCKINNNIAVTLNRGNFTLNKSVVTNTNNVEIKTNTGNFYANEAILGNVLVKQNNRAMIQIKQCFVFNFNAKTAGGSIDIDKVNELALVASDTNVNIGEIITGGSINLSASGKINVKTISAQTSITTNDGNITVDNASSALRLETIGNGNIVLKNTTASLFAETVYGDITVYFDQSAESYSSTSNARYLQAKTSSGDILASGVDKIDINITGKGNASIYMHDVLNESTVKANSGYVYVEFADSASFILNTLGKVNVNYSALSGLGETNHDFEGEKTFTINSTASNENSLNINLNSGYAKIRDKSMKNF